MTTAERILSAMDDVPIPFAAANTLAALGLVVPNNYESEFGLHVTCLRNGGKARDAGARRTYEFEDGSKIDTGMHLRDVWVAC